MYQFDTEIAVYAKLCQTAISVEQPYAVKNLTIHTNLQNYDITLLQNNIFPNRGSLQAEFETETQSPIRSGRIIDVRHTPDTIHLAYTQDITNTDT